MKNKKYNIHKTKTIKIPNKIRMFGFDWKIIKNKNLSGGNYK